MTHSPGKPDTSKQNEPLTQAQFETLNTMLKTLVNLIMPLHKLLESQGGLEDEVTMRLEQVIDALATISTSLRTSATALSDMKTSQADFRRMEKRLAALAGHQTGLGTRLESMEKQLEMLVDWLGARPPRLAAAPIS
jgi:hypothetical protein